MAGGIHIQTSRLTLRSWTDDDRAPFAVMNADPVVMADLGGPLSRVESDAKFDAFASYGESHGYTRWVVEGRLAGSEPAFLGYCGVKPHGPDHPLGAHADIGWRLRHEAWSHGFATEAARAALDDVFERVALRRVLAYTAADNHRSQAVMGRLGLERDATLDFDMPDEVLGSWHGLVWVATAAPSD